MCDPGDSRSSQLGFLALAFFTPTTVLSSHPSSCHVDFFRTPYPRLNSHRHRCPPRSSCLLPPFASVVPLLPSSHLLFVRLRRRSLLRIIIIFVTRSAAHPFSRSIRPSLSRRPCSQDRRDRACPWGESEGGRGAGRAH